METLKACCPYLCIDIHVNVKAKQSALLGGQPLLEGLGYRCDTDGYTIPFLLVQCDGGISARFEFNALNTGDKLAERQPAR